MPLSVSVAGAPIPDALQDEIAPRSSAVYESAVRSALATWERELEGLVHFRLVEKPERARLTLRLHAERAPAPEPTW